MKASVSSNNLVEVKILATKKLFSKQLAQCHSGFEKAHQATGLSWATLEAGCKSMVGACLCTVYCKGPHVATSQI